MGCPHVNCIVQADADLSNNLCTIDIVFLKLYTLYKCKIQGIKSSPPPAYPAFK